jgi:acetoin utilization protein AcuB
MIDHTSPIRDFMTPAPVTICRAQRLSDAARRMHEHHIRHLAVLEGGFLFGILSERDIDLVEALPDCNPDEVTVEAAMTQDPYTVKADTPVREVAAAMAEHTYGTAVVMDQGRVAGIFTTGDALRLLAEMLSPPGARAAVEGV